jgi:hypothetical protein
LRSLSRQMLIREQESRMPLNRFLDSGLRGNDEE